MYLCPHLVRRQTLNNDDMIYNKKNDIIILGPPQYNGRGNTDFLLSGEYNQSYT